MTRYKGWYADKPNRKCSDCGEPVDWDERLRLGHYAIGGPAYPDGTPLYAPARAYGNTPEGRAEQAKLEAHHNRFHRGGLVDTINRNGWRLEVHRYDAGPAFSCKMLLAKRPFYGILSTATPTGGRVNTIIEGCKSPAEVEALAFTVA